MDNPDPGNVTQNDVEFLLTIGLDGDLMFMPDALHFERLRWAKVVAKVMREKAPYSE